MKRFLITTADERTWTDDQPVLFLGEWCKRYSRRKVWQSINSIVAPYHWDDRIKLFKDYNYLQKIYEEQLQELSLKLNQIHGVDHSLRYWRILIGPWLGFFIQILFDRWFMLKGVVEQNEVSACKILERNSESAIPNDMFHFARNVGDDNWNEKIYGQLLELIWGNDLHIEKIAMEIDIGKKRAINFKNWKMFPKKLAKKIASLLYPLTVKEREYFFISSYLPLKTNCFLQIRLGQVPKIWPFINAAKIKPNMKKRLECNLSVVGKDPFLDVLSKMIPLNIPTIYLEGYKVLLRKINGLPWPKRPKGIFTSNSYSADDVFKAWAAEKTEKGAPLIIGQHGGHSGMSPWAFFEEHQITTADAWLSWGWSLKNKPQVKPVGNLKECERSVSYDPNGLGLMVEMSLPRYSYHMYAIPVAGQWLSYFEDQCRFISALPDILQEKLLVRLFPVDWGWEHGARLRDKFPNIKTNSERGSIPNLVKKSRIFIATYNSTTYLEALTWNVPTIVFWNPEHWELKEDVKPYFEQLKSVGIFHETPESAANQMITVWDDIVGWWESDEVQNVRHQFCDRFSNVPKKPIDKLVALFKEMT
jgi:putative transferase (TIGR04331 family)